METNQKCANCGKELSPIRKRFCNKTCYSDYKTGKPYPAAQGEKHGMWKGNNVGYHSLHQWISSRKPKPKFCEKCKKEKPKDLSNISGDYQRKISDYEWLCRKCHMIKDGRIKREA